MCMSPIFSFVWWSWQQFLSRFPWNQWPWQQALSASLHTVSIIEHVWRRKRRRRGMDTTGYYTRILPGYYLDTIGSSWTRSNTINHWYNGERRERGREGGKERIGEEVYMYSFIFSSIRFIEGHRVGPSHRFPWQPDHFRDREWCIAVDSVLSLWEQHSQ